MFLLCFFFMISMCVYIVSPLFLCLLFLLFSHIFSFISHISLLFYIVFATIIKRRSIATGQWPGKDRAATGQAHLRAFLTFIFTFSFFFIIFFHCVLCYCEFLIVFHWFTQKSMFLTVFHCFSLFVIVFSIIVNVLIVFHFFVCLYCFMYDCDFFTVFHWFTKQ